MRVFQLKQEYICIRYITILNHVKDFFSEPFSASSVIFRNLHVVCAWIWKEDKLIFNIKNSSRTLSYRNMLTNIINLLIYWIKFTTLT